MHIPRTVFYLLFLHIRIAQISKQPVPDNADYLIILGSRVIGTDSSLILQERPTNRPRLKTIQK